MCWIINICDRIPYMQKFVTLITEILTRKKLKIAYITCLVTVMLSN